MQSYYREVITEKELKYFTYSFKNASCLGKMYLLPKRLYNVPGRPVISDCWIPTEKVSEFLDHQLQPVTKGCKYYVKDTNHFLEKLKEPGKVPPNAILVTADVVGAFIPASCMIQVSKLCMKNWKKEMIKVFQ